MPGSGRQHECGHALGIGRGDVGAPGRQRLDDGEMPTAEAVNGVLILAGGLLMLVPGFVTGVIGLLLLLPPVRALLRPIVIARVQRRIDRGAARFVVFSSGSRMTGPMAGGPGTFGGPVYDADSHLDQARGPGQPDRAGPPAPPPELGP